MSRFDRIQKRLIRCVKLLISATPESCVVDLVHRPAVEIRIAWIDPAEVRQQRNQPPAAMVNSIAHLMDLGDFIPRKNITESKFYARYHFDELFHDSRFTRALNSVLYQPLGTPNRFSVLHDSGKITSVFLPASVFLWDLSSFFIRLDIFIGNE
jgi:hypothetical protein